MQLYHFFCIVYLSGSLTPSNTHTHMYTPNHRTPSYTRTNQIVRECVIKQKVEWNKTNSFFPPETFHEWKMTHIIFSKFSMLFYFISLIVKFRSFFFFFVVIYIKNSFVLAKKLYHLLCCSSCFCVREWTESLLTIDRLFSTFYSYVFLFVCVRVFLSVYVYLCLYSWIVIVICHFVLWVVQAELITEWLGIWMYEWVGCKIAMMYIHSIEIGLV